jgi:antitoxin component of MazEF toxin-antitoxin module
MKIRLRNYKLRKSGSGAVITIPSTALDALKIAPGSEVEIYLAGSTVLIIKPVKLDPIFSGIMESVRPK